jgi:predicted DNA-binding transcriptional regulator YafY
MTKTERLVYLTRFLQGGKSYTIDEIAIACRVSRRTAYRDIVSLSEMNFMLENSGGYCLKTGTEGDSPDFTPLELEIIGYSLSCSPLNNLPPFHRTIKGIEAKLLSCHKMKRADTLNTCITGRKSSNGVICKKDESILKKFTYAMMSGQKVRVRLLDEKADCIKARPKKMKIMGRQVLLYLECDVDHKRKVLRPQEIRNLMIVNK